MPLCGAVAFTSPLFTAMRGYSLYYLPFLYKGWLPALCLLSGVLPSQLSACGCAFYTILQQHTFRAFNCPRYKQHTMKNGGVAAFSHACLGWAWACCGVALSQAETGKAPSSHWPFSLKHLSLSPKFQDQSFAENFVDLQQTCWGM